MTERIKVNILLSSISVFTALGAGCSSSPPVSNSTANGAPLIKTEPAKPMSDKGDSVVTGGDLGLMNAAAQANMAEVEVGRMAAQKGQSADVKAFGQKMIEDHSKSLDEFKQLAAQKNVVLPPAVAPPDKQLSEKLSKLNGGDFDRAYVTAMVQDHEKDVAAFSNESKTGADADVKALAAKTLPILQMHLDMIKGIAGKMGLKMK